MPTVMHSCDILHNMVVEEERPHIELRETIASVISVSDEVNCSFVRVGHIKFKSMPGTITALIVTNRYLNSA